MRERQLTFSVRHVRNKFKKKKKRRSSSNNNNKHMPETSRQTDKQSVRQTSSQADRQGKAGRQAGRDGQTDRLQKTMMANQTSVRPLNLVIPRIRT